MYPDLSMGGTACLRYMIGRDVRIMEGVADEMPGKGVKSPDHMAMWSRTGCHPARSGVSMEFGLATSRRAANYYMLSDQTNTFNSDDSE